MPRPVEDRTPAASTPSRGSRALDVFVLGLDGFQLEELYTTRPREVRFHPLLDVDSLVTAEKYDLDELLDRARGKLQALTGEVDAIVTHWDFPTSVIGPILSHEWGLPAPSLESVVACEHKYWSRLAQAESVPECVPEFRAFDPFENDPLATIDMPFPFWVKPIKGHSSQLGFEVADEAGFHEALQTIREEVGRIADPFEQVLHRVEAPPEIARMPASTCLAEQIISGVQAAPEGSMARGHYAVHGVLDMHRQADGHGFSRLEYPSRLPDEVQERMIDLSERYLRHVGFDDGCFNAEFMWDRDRDQLWLVEVNTRMSQSHSDLFAKVDGMSNHEIAIDVALGRRPSLPTEKGAFDCAAKILLTHDEDAIVRRVPSDEDLERLRERFPETRLRVEVETGQRLGELANQDSYHFNIAEVFLGADSPTSLDEGQQACRELLRFEFEPVS